MAWVVVGLSGCPVCGNPKPVATQAFCSRTCSNRSRSSRVEVACETCKKTFRRPRSHVARVSKSFCSQKCNGKSKERQVERMCVVCSSPFSVSVSYVDRLETCEKPECRRARLGERNSNWKGGVHKSRRPEWSSKRYQEWRRAVFTRDDYVCQMCGCRGGDLNADHIMPWAFFLELRYELSNGRTLCVPCHRSIFKEVFSWRGCAAS